MAGIVEGGFALTGLMDGTTINGYLRVEHNPLVQRYTKGTDKFVPDFEAMSEDIRPVVVPILTNLSDGAVLAPNTVVWKYNGVDLTFGADNLSTNSGMEGVFKRLTGYSTNVGGTSHSLPALRVMKNLVPLSGYDNDRISVSGTVESGGNSAEFNELSTPVVIEESEGNVETVLIDSADGFTLTDQLQQILLKALVNKDGVPVSDVSGYTFKWIKTGTEDIVMGTAQTQTVRVADVNGMATIRCEVRLGGALIGTGYVQVVDNSDPVLVRIDITGISGTQVKAGQTATVTPKAVKRSTGEEQSGLVSTWTFRTKDNTGADFTLTGKNAATFTGKNCSVTYADIKRAKMGITGYVKAEF